MSNIEKKAREYAKKEGTVFDDDNIQSTADLDLQKAFLAGAAYAIGNQWRDAEKEKPEDGEYVLIYHPKFGIEPAVWNERFDCWDDAENNECMCSAENVDVWLEIPEYKPKEK